MIRKKMKYLMFVIALALTIFSFIGMWYCIQLPFLYDCEVSFLFISIDILALGLFILCFWLLIREIEIKNN